jgi:hypothetical protein
MLTPKSMQIENKKLPKNDSMKTSSFVRELIIGSLVGFFNQCIIANPPMPKRSHASKNTGNTMVSGFESAT